jgi:hypothetical protein
VSVPPIVSVPPFIVIKELTVAPPVEAFVVKFPLIFSVLVLSVNVRFEAVEPVLLLSAREAQASDLALAIVTVMPAGMFTISPATGNELPPQVALLFQLPFVVAVRVAADVLPDAKSRMAVRKIHPLFFISPFHLLMTI